MLNQWGIVAETVKIGEKCRYHYTEAISRLGTIWFYSKTRYRRRNTNLFSKFQRSLENIGAHISISEDRILYVSGISRHPTPYDDGYKNVTLFRNEQYMNLLRPKQPIKARSGLSMFGW